MIFDSVPGLRGCTANTPNLPTKIINFRGFDSSRILSLRGGILMSIGHFPSYVESTNPRRDSLSRDNLSREIGCRTGQSIV